MSGYEQKIMVTGEPATMAEIERFAAISLEVSLKQLSRAGVDNDLTSVTFGETGVMTSLVTAA